MKDGAYSAGKMNICNRKNCEINKIGKSMKHDLQIKKYLNIKG